MDTLDDGETTETADTQHTPESAGDVSEAEDSAETPQPVGDITEGGGGQTTAGSTDVSESQELTGTPGEPPVVVSAVKEESAGSEKESEVDEKAAGKYYFIYTSNFLVRRCIYIYFTNFLVRRCNIYTFYFDRKVFNSLSEEVPEVSGLSGRIVAPIRDAAEVGK